MSIGIGESAEVVEKERGGGGGMRSRYDCPPTSNWGVKEDEKMNQRVRESIVRLLMAGEKRLRRSPAI